MCHEYEHVQGAWFNARGEVIISGIQPGTASVVGLSFAVSLDAAAIAYLMGWATVRPNVLQFVKVMVMFVTLHGLLMLAGHHVAAPSEHWFSQNSIWLIGAAVLLLGLRSFVSPPAIKSGKKSSGHLSFGLLLLIAFATSLDSLLVGFIGSKANISALSTMVICLAAVLICVASGYSVGLLFGCRQQRVS